VVIGTAGHVDHGKTALVKTLTGTDTDRWEEEKRRGITIDLGFAHLDLGDDTAASIVDVPGHEDFVRNMVAGATGIDVALMVIAADEGVMPQTLEHLSILEFLGVRSGVVAISKVDLVEADWLELVQTDVTERIGASSVRWEPPVCFSAQTGEGSEELRRALTRAAATAVEQSADDVFRMPVDRAFSIAGAGTVVTGTTWSGSVAVGEEVTVLPGGIRARVRSVEVHGEARDRAEPGRRTALALPGVDKTAAARGCVVVSGTVWQATSVVDVMLTLLPGSRTLTQRSRVRFHLGTAEVMARVTPAEDEIAQGATMAARLRTEQPIVARWGDRGVIRSYSPMRTIGGCIVVDPSPPRRPRRPRDLEARLVVEPVERVRQFVEAAGPDGLDVTELAIRVGIHPSQVQPVATQVGSLGAVRIGDRLVRQAAVDNAREECVTAVTAYHQERPLEPGMPRELLRAVTRTPGLADHVVTELSETGIVSIEAGIVRLAAFHPTLTPEERALTEAMLRALRDAGPRGCSEAELANLVRHKNTRNLAAFLVRERTAARVGQDRYYDPDSLERLRETVVRGIRERGQATPAELRNMTGLTRKYLIPILEWLDGAGYTVREGDARRLGPAAPAAGNGT
jgi:selenocysteine-specific elongation factor